MNADAVDAWRAVFKDYQQVTVDQRGNLRRSRLLRRNMAWNPRKVQI